MSTNNKTKDGMIMKNFLILTLLAFVSLTVLPVAVLKNGTYSPESIQSDNEFAVSSYSGEENESENTDDSSITVFLSNENETVTVSDFEYTCGSVAAEMPITYHEEALKAQAVACYTNALRLKNSAHAENLSGADISDDSGTHQGYISIDERKEKWGENFEKYESRLETTVNGVLGQYITFNGEPCVAAFSAICTGLTESAENVWGSNIPYLVSVKSNGDTLSPSYTTTAMYSREQLNECLKTLDIKPEKDEDFSKFFKTEKKSKAGTVLSIKAGKTELTGAQIKNAFSLKSASFDIKQSKNSVTFTVYGYGHGVGMSQYGADYMARQGSTYDEILKHYYSGVEISEK